jgi:hypothetical protein
MWKLKYLCSTTAIVDGLLNWQGYWQGVLSREEEIHVSILADEVPAVQLREDMKDTYKCLLDEDRGFLMKGNAAMSCCLDKVFLQTTMQIFCLLNTFQFTIHILSYGIRQCHRKSVCLAGNCCRDRLPTRVELWRRGFIWDVDQQCSVICFDNIESASHLFVNCIKIRKLWDLIFEWLDWKEDGWSTEIVNKFLLFNFMCKGKKGKKVSLSHMIWLATVYKLVTMWYYGIFRAYIVVVLHILC